MAKNANFVSHKKSKQIVDGKPKLPLASDIVEGEIAINFGKDVETLSIKNESGDVVTFSSDNYYTEQKLGSAFTGSNSAVTVTDVIVEVVQTTGSSSADVMSQSAVTEAINSKQIEVDQTIDSDTSASTNAVSTSAVYGFVTSYTPSITVDQVLDNTTSASTNPVSSKAVYDAVTDNELVWTNAYVALSGTISAHTENTEIHVTAADKEKINSISTLSGTVTAHTANTSIHLTTTEKTNLDSLATNIAAISGITSTNVTNWNGASTDSHTHSNRSALDSITSENVSNWDGAYEKVSGITASTAALNSITGSVGSMAYENANSYSSATEVNTALAGKSNTGHTHTSNEITAMTNYTSAVTISPISTSDSLNTAIGKLEHSLGGAKIVITTQAAYDALVQADTVDPTTLYVITD